MTIEVEYAVIAEKNVMATMRDGIRLAADVYRPDIDQPVPAVLIRSPYNKVERIAEYGDALVRAGYAIVLQDVRGRYASEGVFRQSVDDAWGENQDGYDSVEWVASLPWCDGRVAATGISAPASSATLMMPTQPPHLVAGVLEVSGAVDSYIYRFYNGGVFRWQIMRWMLTSMSPDIVAREVTDEALRERVLAKPNVLAEDPAALAEAYAELPLLPTTRIGDLDAPGLDFWREWLSNQTYNDYWKALSALQRVDAFTVPLAHVSGWFDTGLQGTIDCFRAVQERGGDGARGQQRLVVGPWVHQHDLWVDQAGELTFPDGGGPLRNPYLIRYFDTYVKQLPTGLLDEPPVQIYVMGDNVWRGEHEWPLARTEYVPYYLRDGGPAAMSGGGALLSTATPAADEAADEFDYDPADPTPTVAGRHLVKERQGPRDCRSIESRGLTFTTEVLADDVEKLTGQVRARIFAASSAKDTDWVVTLTDVHPDGRSMWVAGGILRARFRDSLEEPSLITPDEIYEYDIDLWATSQVFKAGHRIRVVVGSSDFPHYARNLNTGADNHTTTETAVAHQTIYHDAEHPSRVVLPLIPRTAGSAGPAVTPRSTDR